MSKTSSPKKAAKRHNNLAIQGLMRLVNSVPADVKLPEPAANWKEILRLLKSKKFKKYRKLTGPIRCRRLFVGSYSPLTSDRILGRYEALRLGRQWLQSIAAIGENLRRQHEWQSGRAKWTPPSLPQRCVSMFTDEEGLLRFALVPLVEALEGIRVVNFRNCPVCKKFFLASRKDKPGCTSRCAHILRTRRYREKYFQSYKQNRIKEYERKRLVSLELDKNDAR